MLYCNKIKDPQLIQKIDDEYANGNGLATREIADMHNLTEQSVVILLEDLGKLKPRR